MASNRLSCHGDQRGRKARKHAVRRAGCWSVARPALAGSGCGWARPQAGISVARSATGVGGAGGAVGNAQVTAVVRAGATGHGPPAKGPTASPAATPGWAIVRHGASTTLPMLETSVKWRSILWLSTMGGSCGGLPAFAPDGTGCTGYTRDSRIRSDRPRRHHGSPDTMGDQPCAASINRPAESAPLPWHDRVTIARRTPACPVAAQRRRR